MLYWVFRIILNEKKLRFCIQPTVMSQIIDLRELSERKPLKGCKIYIICIHFSFIFSASIFFSLYFTNSLSVCHSTQRLVLYHPLSASLSILILPVNSNMNVIREALLKPVWENSIGSIFIDISQSVKSNMNQIIIAGLKFVQENSILSNHVC